MEHTHTLTGLAIRWILGVILMLVIRLALEERLPGGVAMGLALGAFMLIWMRTVPVDAYRRASPHRRLLYMRFGFFLLAVGVAGIGFRVLS